MAEITRAYILAKNERRNIDRSVAALVKLNIPTTVLDSGSTDGTQDAAKAGGAEVRDFVYVNHCESYNTILQWHKSDEVIAILDADMRVTPELADDVNHAFTDHAAIDAAIAPVEMYWDARPLRHSSLYPPKPLAFRGGRPLFKPAGHGEQLILGLSTTLLRSKLIHDDQKSLELVLANQVRYARDTVRRAQSGNLRFKDKLRLKTPIYMIGLPLFAYIFRGGFRDGRTGIVYALDRLIAEAITLREANSQNDQSQVAKQDKGTNA